MALLKNKKKISKKAPARIFTIGHSNRKISEFIHILEAYKLKLLIDVRTVPKSRHNPQFGEKRLQASLKKKGIEYVHVSGQTSHRPHKLTSFAKVRGGSVTYPAE
jgi:uncharacterized protein (DUF488 family)